MALEATHIRYALDTKNRFGVVDVNKHVSGSVYPDSRYPTGIDRTLTHDDSQMKKDFWCDDDFRKGWAAHLLYDKIQHSVHTDWFKDILKKPDAEITGEEDWIIRSALKMLQDIEDVKQFNIKQHLSALQHVENPNDEDVVVVHQYNQMLFNLYNKTGEVSIEDLEQMWICLTVSTENAAKMRQKAYEIQGDPELTQLVKNIYDETVKRTDEFFNRYCL
jgi:hypothetical protein